MPIPRQFALTLRFHPPCFSKPRILRFFSPFEEQSGDCKSGWPVLASDFFLPTHHTLVISLWLGTGPSLLPPGTGTKEVKPLFSDSCPISKISRNLECHVPRFVVDFNLEQELGPSVSYQSTEQLHPMPRDFREMPWSRWKFSKSGLKGGINMPEPGTGGF